MRIYVASSWRNTHQPAVVTALREQGHQVYDFRNPSWDDTGFSWSEIDPDWKEWDFDEYRSALEHPIALHGYRNDMRAMEKCEACVLVLPCGRSAHLELGWFAGKGRATCIYNPPTIQVEPELMAKMCDAQKNSIDAVLSWAESARPRGTGMKIGDKVKLKGRDPRGTIESIKNNWVRVNWEMDHPGPKHVDLYELEAVPDIQDRDDGEK